MPQLMNNHQHLQRKKRKRKEKRIWMAVATSAMKAICLDLRKSLSMMRKKDQRMKKRTHKLKLLRKSPRKQQVPMATCGKRTEKVKVEKKLSRQNLQKRTRKRRNRIKKRMKSRLSM